jgi:hypothetical protein
VIEKLQTPLKFDNEQAYAIVARDGEKFFVASMDLINSDPSTELLEMGARPLLQWALEINYPLRKFVKLQKYLTQRFIGG